MSPLRTAMLAQVVGALIALAIALVTSPGPLALSLTWALGQGVCAALISHKLGAPLWWLPIHLVFFPLALALNQTAVPPSAWMGAFVLMFLLFWRTDKSRVPLFLTNKKAALTVAKSLPDRPFLCIDIGCGTGSLLQQLAKARPDCNFVGVEHAPIPFFIAWLRSRRLHNLVVKRGDFWQMNLRHYQVVYAFLSPVPMPRLWQKVNLEMAPDSLVISNSFIIPGIIADNEVRVADRRRTRLYYYKVPASN